MTGSRLLSVLTFLVVLGFAAVEAGDKPKAADAVKKAGGDHLPVVYDDVTGGSGKLDREAKRIYAGKFQIIEVTTKEGFTPARLKGPSFGDFRSAYTDPRGGRERETAFKVVYLFIVTVDGRAIEPRLVESTDPRMSEPILRSFAYRRWIPARFRGVPVAALHSFDIDEGPQHMNDDGSAKNGLGLPGYRDR